MMPGFESFPSTGDTPQYINFLIIGAGAFLTYISMSSLFSNHFLRKLIQWQNAAQGIHAEITEGQIFIGKLSAFIGTIGGVISLIIGFNSL
ncbi:MAG: hypothetical protein Q8P72_04635 [Candidatus Roizmanbacteria bacterium]|nr:hypothetical protein [Candidatus Roizmanbacteria bacterium]